MKFLLVDHPSHRPWIAGTLRREFPGCTLVEAGDATELATPGEGPFDLAIVGDRLPRATPVTVLHTLREHDSALPVLVFASAGSEESAVAAMKAGASDYLSAAHRERLPRVVRTCLDEGRQAALGRVPRRRLVEILQTLLDHVPLMLSVWGPDGRLAVINRAVERTLGWSLRDYREGEAFSSCHPDPVARQEALAAVASGYDGWRDFRVRTRWGHDLDTRWLILRLSGGMRVCVGEDVSQGKETEERLREQAALLDHARDAIIVCDMEDRIIEWNRGAERLYGWAAAEVLGLRIGDVLDREGVADREAIRRRLLECGEWQGELEQATRAGEKLAVESSQTLLRDAEGRPRARLAINTDVTDKKRLEARMVEARGLESIGRLAGGIAHELNNVLTPLRLGIDFLLSGPAEGSQRSILETLQEGVSRGAELVQRVLSFARGGGGERRPLAPGSLLRDAEKMLRQLLPRSIALELAVPADLWEVIGDGARLSQVLLNLALNARDAMPEGGTLALRAENCDLAGDALPHPDARPGRYVRLTVTDTGRGMTPEVRERIFDPFFTTKQFGQGSGLGLSTVRGIVRTHGGFIEVTSVPDAGTTVEVSLPVAGGPVAASEEQAGGEMPAGQGQWILVVDDESAIRELGRTVLETFGYRVLTAADGQEALHLFRAHRGQVRLALVDMMMPVLDGPATIHGLRAMDPSLAVIAASGLDSPSPPGAAHLTLQGFLRKPYSAQALLQAIRKVLGSAPP